MATEAATAEAIIDLTVLHQIGLQRHSLYVLRRIQSTLQQLRKDIEDQLADRLGRGENARREPSSVRLQGLLQQVTLTQEEAHRSIASKFLSDVDAIADNEAAFITGLSATAVGTEVNLATVSSSQMRSAVMSNPMQGKSLVEWTKQLEVGDVSRMRQQITLGYLEGESIPQIAKRVKIAGAVTDRGAETLARTSVTHINARAVETNARANPEVFKQYQWISVLDNRTTPVCRARAGKVFRHGGNPLPPAHPNCRSTIYSLVKGVPPADDLGFGTWLEKQPLEVQRDILGPTRHKLWKDGKLPMDGFVDGGRALTIEQLRKQDAAAFARAGL